MTIDIETIGVAMETGGLVKGQRALRDTEQAANRTADAADKLGSSAQKADQKFSALESSLGLIKRALAGLGVAIVAREFVQMADAVTLMEARLRLAAKTGQEFAQAQADVYRIAQANNVGLRETATLYTKLADPVRRLGGTTRETAAIVDAFAMSLRISGASTMEASAATLQFAQAMASGRLQGDEFRSLAENSPRFMRALADGMGLPIMKLKEMGADGKLTADVVGNALVQSLAQLKQEARGIPDTVGGAFTRLMNDVLLTVDAFNKLTGVTPAVASSLGGLSGGVQTLGEIFKTARDNGDGFFAMLWKHTEIARLLGMAGGSGAKITKEAVDAMSVLRIGGASQFMLSDKMLQRQGGAGYQELKGEPVIDAAAAKKAERELRAAQGKAAADYNKELEEQAKLLTELAGLQGSFYEDWARLSTLYADGAINLDQLTKAQGELLSKQPAIKANLEAEAKDRDEIAKIIATNTAVRDKEIDALAKSVGSMFEQNKALTGEIELIGLEGRARIDKVYAMEQERIAAAELALVWERSIPGNEARVSLLENEIRLRKENADLTRTGAGKSLVVDEAKKAAEEWKRTTDSINDTLTDALLRGFDAGKTAAQNLRDTVVNMFKTMVLRPVISAIMSPISAGIGSALGMSGANAGGLLSGASTLGGLGNLFGGSGGLAGMGTGLMNGLSAWGPGGSVMGVFGNAGLYTGMELLGAAMPIIGGLLAVASLFKGSGETRAGAQYGYGVTPGMGTFGTAGAQYYSGPSGGQIAGGQVIGSINATVQGINETLKALGSSATVVGFQAALETSGKGRGGVFAGGTLSSGVRFGDLGAGGGRSNYDGTLYDPTKSRSPDGEQAIKLLALDLKQSMLEALQASGDLPRTISRMLDGRDIAKLTEAQTDKLIGRINTQIAAVNLFGDAVQALPFTKLRDLSFDAASALIRYAGGIEQLQAGLATYYENFYSEEEKRANTIRLIQAELKKGGISLTQGEIGGMTRDEFRDLVDAQEALGTAGLKSYSALIKVSGAFASITDAAGKAAQALIDKIDSYRDAEQSLKAFKAGLNVAYGQLTPQALYDQLTQQITTAQAGVKVGNLKTLDQLDELIGQWLDASKDMYGSSAQYFTDMAQAQALLTAAITVADGKADKLTGYASGGVFTNGIFSSPTSFHNSQMGEGGQSEAVMPLTSINGSLGVRASGADNRELVTEVKRLQDLVTKQTTLIDALLRNQAAIGSKSIATQERTAQAVERGSALATMEAARK